ncbi:unnamed protein product [Soboliphyme baturini]|uniref:OTU domain-containing protein n=1 Tax=Soboliphyme baturini TaxID=241478 RepID=A0A183J4E0_9BILA|nr:unnamed protein product [Soboliphyme baturini]
MYVYMYITILTTPFKVNRFGLLAIAALKELRARQLEKSIQEAERDAEKSKRRLEEKSLKKVLMDRHLTRHRIPGDGDCMFNALAHQFSLMGITVTLQAGYFLEDMLYMNTVLIYTRCKALTCYCYILLAASKSE